MTRRLASGVTAAAVTGTVRARAGVAFEARRFRADSDPTVLVTCVRGRRPAEALGIYKRPRIRRGSGSGRVPRPGDKNSEMKIFNDFSYIFFLFTKKIGAMLMPCVVCLLKFVQQKRLLRALS